MMAAGVATALYGWMERFAREGVAWDWESLYAACAAAGVDAVETDPTPPKRAILDRLGLRVSASYIGMPLTPPFAELEVDDRVLPVARRLAATGGHVLVLNSDGPGATGSAAKTGVEVARQGANLSRIADLVAPLGLRIALHNHAAEHDAAAADLASVIDHADDAVGVCIDTGWALAARHDPVAWARELGPRVLGVHLRDARDGAVTEALGEGHLDLAAFLGALGDYDGWLTLELWHPASITPRGSMHDAVRSSTELLRRLTGRDG